MVSYKNIRSVIIFLFLVLLVGSYLLSVDPAVASRVLSSSMAAIPSGSVDFVPPDENSIVYLPIIQDFESHVLLAVGDIGDCNRTQDEATAQVVGRNHGTLAVLGDAVYPIGSPTDFANCYDPAWGEFKSRTRPAPGNHEYITPDAAGYFDYFGSLAGETDKGYYSYDLGSWHIVVLNSVCAEVGGCDKSSPQGQWLQADLAANPTHCSLLYFHHPRFSSGYYGVNPDMEPFWQMAYDAGVDVVLNGHEHYYERFAPQDPKGNLDQSRGIREFIVGAGGGSYDSRVVGDPEPNSEIVLEETPGVLKLTLQPGRYDWEFLPAFEGDPGDAGSDSCR